MTEQQNLEWKETWRDEHQTPVKTRAEIPDSAGILLETVPPPTGRQSGDAGRTTQETAQEDYP